MARSIILSYFGSSRSIFDSLDKCTAKREMMGTVSSEWHAEHVTDCGLASIFATISVTAPQSRHRYSYEGMTYAASLAPASTNA